MDQFPIQTKLCIKLLFTFFFFTIQKRERRSIFHVMKSGMKNTNFSFFFLNRIKGWDMHMFQLNNGSFFLHTLLYPLFAAKDAVLVQWLGYGEILCLTRQWIRLINRRKSKKKERNDIRLSLSLSISISLPSSPPIPLPLFRRAPSLFVPCIRLHSNSFKWHRLSRIEKGIKNGRGLMRKTMPLQTIPLRFV